jgi:RNA polymerase primary sigma factor
MDREKIIAQLIKKAGKDKFLNQDDVIQYADPNSEDYYEIEKALLNEDIDIIALDEVEEEKRRNQERRT